MNTKPTPEKAAATASAVAAAETEIEKAPNVEDKKPKRPPQLHTDQEIRGMLATLHADYPKMSYKDIVKLALSIMCDKISYLPAIKLARLDPETLRIQAGIAAEAEESAKKLIRTIIKAKARPEVADKITGELERDVAAYRELRLTMMRQAAIPMAPNLPEDVSVGIGILEYEKLECPDESRQRECDTCIQILKAYRPQEYDLPKDLRDQLV